MTRATGKTPTYPNREPFFAHRFCRLLTKAAVAQEIGPEACWLLAVIVHQEDAVHYRRGVKFFNEQIMPLCGFGGKSRLATARRKAVEAGWLHYVAGGKGLAGMYWVLIPEGYEHVIDTPCDESPAPICRPESGQQIRENTNPVPNQDGKPEIPSQIGTATGRQPDDKPSTSNPIPFPAPKSAPTKVGTSRNGYSDTFKTWWQKYPLKVGKRTTSKAYATALKDIAAEHEIATADAQERLLAAVTAFAASDKGRGDYVPNPAIWLNQGRYDDDPAVWRDNSKGEPVSAGPATSTTDYTDA